jgi:hypothetical protein
VTSYGEIWLGDLAWSLSLLRPGDASAQLAIARALGFELPMPGPTPASPLEIINDALTDRSKTAAASSRTPPSTDSTSDTSAVIPITLTPMATTARRSRTDWRQVEPLEPFTDRHVAPRLPFEPLFDPQTAPALIAGLVATPFTMGPFDVTAMVEEAARGRPLHELPRLPRRSLGRGVQLLIDLGAAMEPFARDQVELTRAIAGVVGAERIEELGFYACPTRGVLGSRDETERLYRPPDPHVPVIVLGDLGIGRSPSPGGNSRPAEWLELAALLGGRHSQLIAVVPYPDAFWPERLRGAVTFVTWDRSTTVAHLLNAVRK